MNNYETIKKTKPKVITAILWLIIFACFIILISHPAATANAAIKGCTTALKAVLPSTFPYLVLSSLLISSGCCEFLGDAFSFLAKPLKIPPACFSVVLVSLICGFPVGAAMASDMYEKGICSENQAQRLVAFCNFCGPPFIFGVFGATVMNDSKAGLVLFSVQSVGSLILGVILGVLDKSNDKILTESANNSKNNKDEPLSNMICSAICKAGISTVNIFAFIIFFAVFCDMINYLLPFNSPYTRSVIFGFLEISSGMEALKHCENSILKYFIGCFIVYFSGISVHLQVISGLKNNISPKKYIISRIVFAPLAACIATFIYFFI